MEYSNITKDKKILFFLCGRSGSGKDSILKKLFKRNPNLKPVIPVTTRAMRVGEREEVEYFFVDNEKFFQMEKEGKFLDYKTYNVFNSNNNAVDNHYGYPKPTEPISILNGPWDAYVDICKKNPDTDIFRLIPIYITPEFEWELLYRVIKRESRNNPPKFMEVARRFCADQEVYPKLDDIKKLIGEENIIINKDLDKSVDLLESIINKYLKEENFL